MFLCDIPDPSSGEQLAREHACHAVEGVVDDPVEHLDQEGEALEYPAVYVATEARGVRRRDFAAAQVSYFSRVLSRGNIVEVAVTVGCEEVFLRTLRVAIEIACPL